MADYGFSWIDVALVFGIGLILLFMVGLYFFDGLAVAEQIANAPSYNCSGLVK